MLKTILPSLPLAVIKTTQITNSKFESHSDDYNKQELKQSNLCKIPLHAVWRK